MIKKASINGSTFIGVYAACNNNIVVLPNLDVDISTFERALRARVFKTMLGGSPLIGSLMVMNSNGAVVTNFADEREVSFLVDEMNVLFVEDKINAIGNDILANDKVALVHVDFDKETVKYIEEALDVEVVKGTIGGIKTVGSAAVVTNKGMVVHPEVDEEEIKSLKNLFGVPVYVSTANYGSKYLGASLVANDYGAVVGEKTTNVEIDRIENALDIIE
ncbi:translation initiation factor eIF-6, putative [Aciduliprofundum sp. MAR08-339]|uniref:translation initiation factor IF-6 n=1 Tax=Aciduliprofundum sp. (strain MAR08-339) TaxID=673860 RepID=UPI0002A485B7|nr:translation initiation factor eIF-6, putative [Aciduliprofundum sp. MAR08-339]